jgi:hypothetical protein
MKKDSKPNSKRRKPAAVQRLEIPRPFVKQFQNYSQLPLPLPSPCKQGEAGAKQEK